MSNSQNTPAGKSHQKLPRTRILSHRGWVRQVFESGRRYHHKIVSLIELPLQDSTLEPPDQKGGLSLGKVAFFSPKKTGKAHERNRLRRQMKEIYRRELQETHPPCLWVWMAKTTSETQTFESLRSAMHQLVQRSQEKRNLPKQNK